MSGYIGILPVPQATETRNSFTATSSQTSFTTDGYTPNFVSVYLNGVLLSAADFTATNGTDVVLASGAAADDVVEVIAFSTFTVSAQTFTGDVTASGGTFLPTGDTSAGDAAAIGHTSALGIIVTGQGSTNDITLVNDADATVLAVPTGTTNVDIVGVATATTFEPDGDTAAGDNAAIGYTSTEGIIITGQGSTNDVTIKNDADADVIEIPTGTTSVTMTGSLKPLTYQETYVAKSAASTVTCDLATGTSFSVTLDQNTTFAFTNPPSSGTAFSFTLFITQHSTAVTLTWPGTVDWAGGSAPDAAGNNEVQAYGFFTRDGGSTYYGFLGGSALG